MNQGGKWQPSSIRSSLEGRLTRGKRQMTSWRQSHICKSFVAQRDAHTHTHIHKCVFLLSRPELLVLKSLSPGMCPSSLCQLIQRVWYKQNILAVSLWVLGVWFKIRARDEFPLLTDEFYTDPQSYMSPPLTWRHPKLIHSPKRMLHFFPPWFWILVDPSLFKIILPS